MTGTVHIMVDNETLGLNPYSPIIAVGATTGKEHFYGKIKLTKVHSPVSPETMLWWLEQSQEAIKETFFNTDNLYPSMEDLLGEFTMWMNTVTALGKADYKIYGNGVDFDIVMLKIAYEQAGLSYIPWSYKNQMCYRTLKNQFHYIEAPATEGVKHTALADAQNQHKHLMKILNHIDNMETYYTSYAPIIEEHY